MGLSNNRPSDFRKNSSSHDKFEKQTVIVDIKKRLDMTNLRRTITWGARTMELLVAVRYDINQP